MYIHRRAVVATTTVPAARPGNRAHDVYVRERRARKERENLLNACVHAPAFSRCLYILLCIHMCVYIYEDVDGSLFSLPRVHTLTFSLIAPSLILSSFVAALIHTKY